MRLAVFLSGLAFFFLVACKEFHNPFAGDKATLETLRFDYSINFTASGALAQKRQKRGGVGQLHLQTLPVDDGIEVTGRVNTAVDIAIGTHGSAQQLDRDYLPRKQPPVYNIFTLPLRLRYLFVKHRSIIRDTHILLQEINQLERQLLTRGKVIYPAFVKLNVINSGDFSFGGLNKQSSITFAGHRFSTHLAKVRKEIDGRTAALKKSVTYQQHLLKAAAVKDFETMALYVKAVAIYRRVYPDLKRDPQPTSPSFRTRSTHTSPYTKLLTDTVIAISTLKQAKLLLAKTLLRLYEPRYFSYLFDLFGHQEQLSLSVTADDSQQKISQHQAVFSYQLSASSSRQGRFQLGMYMFDRANRPLFIRTNLKLVGKGRIDLILQ